MKLSVYRYNPETNAKYWIRPLYFADDDRLDYRPQDKPLTVENFPPKKRIY